MAEVHVVLTGPIKGEVTMADGTVVDVQPREVYVDSLEAAQEVAHLVSVRYANEGHPEHVGNDNFVYDEATTQTNFAETKG